MSMHVPTMVPKFFYLTTPLSSMFFNFNLALLAALAGAGLVTATAQPNDNERRLARLGRVVSVRQSSCQSDADCGGSSVCCSGLAFGPGEGAGIGSCIDPSACSGGACQALGTGGFCDAD
ncbi:hypothetical protein C8R44DRAFT_869811 [Mycena epipterygia]|nr:hypothetical protein C8R44DRAFT_869811 [Mycena epipterygia]